MRWTKLDGTPLPYETVEEVCANLPIPDLARFVMDAWNVQNHDVMRELVRYLPSRINPEEGEDPEVFFYKDYMRLELLPSMSVMTGEPLENA